MFKKFAGAANALKTVVHQLRAAPHRFDSYTKPLGRTCIYIKPLIQTMLHNSKRTDDSGKVSKEWLQWIDEERCIQAAMLADAADESLVLTRLMDSEDVDPAALHRELQHYIKVIEALFGVVSKVVETFGYTTHVLHQLKHPMVWAVSGQLKTLGGCSLDDITQRCLMRMRIWQSRTMPAIIGAEFPGYECQQAGGLVCGEEKGQR